MAFVCDSCVRARFAFQPAADGGRQAPSSWPGLPAIALTTDTSFLTAYANDFGFEGVFARQVQALGKTGDALLAISTSGGSRNVIAAVNEAKRLGLHVVTLTGSRGPLAAL